MREQTRKLVLGLAKAAILEPCEYEAVEAALSRDVKRARPDKLLNGREACTLAGVSRRTLRAWELAGHVHPKHVTRSRVRFSRNELLAFLGEQAEA